MQIKYDEYINELIQKYKNTPQVGFFNPPNGTIKELQEKKELSAQQINFIVAEWNFETFELEFKSKREDPEKDIRIDSEGNMFFHNETEESLEYEFQEGCIDKIEYQNTVEELKKANKKHKEEIKIVEEFYRRARNELFEWCMNQLITKKLYSPKLKIFFQLYKSAYMPNEIGTPRWREFEETYDKRSNFFKYNKFIQLAKDSDINNEFVEKLKQEYYVHGDLLRLNFWRRIVSGFINSL